MLGAFREASRKLSSIMKSQVFESAIFVAITLGMVVNCPAQAQKSSEPGVADKPYRDPKIAAALPRAFKPTSKSWSALVRGRRYRRKIRPRSRRDEESARRANGSRLSLNATP